VIAVICAVVMVPSDRAVCETFVAALCRLGVPWEVLTDNGRLFTRRYGLADF
jgi:hypothetical protein